MALGASVGSCSAGIERRSEVDRVDVDREVLAADLRVVVVAAGVGHVERSGPGQQRLQPHVPRRGRGQLRVVLVRRDRRRALRGQPAGAQGLQLRVAHGHGVGGVGGERLRVAGTGAVEVGADAAAHDEALRAGHVVGHAEARPDVERREGVARLVDPLARREQAARGTGAGHQRADGRGGVRSQELPGQRIHRLAIRARARSRRRWRTRRRTPPATARARTFRAGSCRPVSGCRTAASRSRSGCRSRASACCSPSSCPGGRIPCCRRCTGPRRMMRPAGTR